MHTFTGPPNERPERAQSVVDSHVEVPRALYHFACEPFISTILLHQIGEFVGATPPELAELDGRGPHGSFVD